MKKPIIYILVFIIALFFVIYAPDYVNNSIRFVLLFILNPFLMVVLVPFLIFIVYRYKTGKEGNWIMVIGVILLIILFFIAFYFT